MTSGFASRLLLTALAFVLVSRTLGAAGFGGFGSVAALAGILACFSGWGADLQIVKSVVRDVKGVPTAWGNGLAFTAMTAPPLLLIGFIVAPLLDHAISLLLVANVMFADVVLGRLMTLAASCYRAVERPNKAALLYAGFSGARLIAAWLWMQLSPADATVWSIWYCAASAIFAAFSVALAWYDFGRPHIQLRRSEVRDGLGFSLITVSNNAAFNVGAPVLAVLSDMSTVGNFVASLRIVEAATIPCAALMFSVMNRFFEASRSGGMQAIRHQALRFLPISFGTGLIGCVGMLVLAKLAPLLLGATYAGTTLQLLVMTPAPILWSIYYVSADALVSAERATVRIVLQCLMPILNVLLCILLVPAFGGLGAAAATLLPVAIVSAITWVILLMDRREVVAS